MKRISLAGVLFLTSSYAFADFKLGVAAGGNYTNFLSGYSRTVDVSGTDYVGTLGPSGLFGYQVGGILRYDKDTWGLEVDALYTKRSVKWRGTLEGGGNTAGNTLEITLTQIEVPFMGYYKFQIQETDLRLGIGLYGAYGLGKIRVEDNYTNAPTAVSATGNYTWKEFGFKPINVGALAAIGSDFKMGEAASLGVELRAQTSFTDYADRGNTNFASNSEKIGLLSIDLLVNFVF